MTRQQIVVAAVLMAGIGMAQQGDRMAADRVAADLRAPLWRLPPSVRVRLTAQPASQATKPGEAGRVRLTLKNVSDGPVGFGAEMGKPQVGNLLAVYLEDGTAVPRVPPEGGIFGERESGVRKTLDPGEELTDTLDVGKIFDVTRKGKYYVRVAQVVYRPQAGASSELAMSDVVTFVIAE